MSIIKCILVFLGEKSEEGDWFPDELDVAVATEADLEGPEAGYGCGEAGVEVNKIVPNFCVLFK